MATGLDQLKHIVVLMMENRSFDHMLGSLTAVNPQIDGITDQLSNPDTTGAVVKPQPLAEFQGQLDPDPDHHFPAVDLQIFGGNTSPGRVPNMQGFVKSYFNQQEDVAHSQKIMYYFAQKQLPVLSTLALEFAVFNRWFASIPGPTICNRAFAHYGTSFGQVGMDVFYVKEPYKSIYDRMIAAGRTAKIYYYDTSSSTMEVVNLLQNEPKLFATYPQFLSDCANGSLPDYSFVEPNYSDHDTDDGEGVASDQHPDHNVQAGEAFIASIYNAIKQNAGLWASTALLVVYDEHGGIYDHVAPPNCSPNTPDGFAASANDTGMGMPFAFDRLGVRVPAILISPWVPKGSVVDGRTFEHASIPATVTKFFLGSYAQRTAREAAADTFVDLLSLDGMRQDCPDFG
ncbi:MAG: alkaline phosphatase family protein [Candidatus Sulfotelmatobacter sp.]|jgi:phospholipase C